MRSGQHRPVPRLAQTVGRSLTPESANDTATLGECSRKLELPTIPNGGCKQYDFPTFINSPTGERP